MYTYLLIGSYRLKLTKASEFLEEAPLRITLRALSRNLRQLLGAHLPAPAAHHADALLALQLGMQVHQVVDVRIQIGQEAVLGAPHN